MTSPKSTCRVLVADDNQANQRLLIKMLKIMGHTGMVVSDGAEALRCIETHSFDVVLMDSMMPVMSGLEALAALRDKERARGGHLPVIMVTANCDRIDQFKYQQAGADGWVAKPIRMDILQSELEKSLCKLP
jgi:CheY-like chemotaxis protein